MATANRSTPRTIRVNLAEQPMQSESQCIRGLPFPFRHASALDNAPSSDAEFVFPETQVWTRTSSKIEFIYEHPAVVGGQDGAENEPDAAVEAAELLDLSSPLEAEIQPTGEVLATCEATPPRITGLLISPRESPQPARPTTNGQYTWTYQHNNNEESPNAPNTSSSQTSVNLFSPCISTIQSETTTSAASPQQHWPLADYNEALLLRHFVVKLSQWFDYCDPSNTFATSVVRCAVESPPLLYAILAASARHLSMTRRDHDSFTADRYHRKCLSILIPALNDNAAALDEALFAATVVLRLYEEMSVPIAGKDFGSHLIGSHTFVRAQEHHLQTAIQLAAFRVVLRQEIVLTFRSQRPVQLLEKYIQVDKSLGQDDWALTFHIFVLCAEVLTACYGDDPKTPKTWNELETRLQEWFNLRPATFDPVIYRAPSGDLPDGNVFPEVLLLNDFHVGAHTHYLICRILLCAHDPRGTRLGPGRAEAVEKTNDAIRDHVRDICGIALSNTHCIPSMFTASAVIAMCGDLFASYREQKAMYDILVHTHTELAWPTDTIQANLRHSWGWDKSRV